MNLINPKNYDYLWTDHNVNYIFTSCYLFPEFRKIDFVLIYEWRKKGLKFFLSKKDRKILSDFGVIFYKKHFTGWKEKALSNIKKGKKIVLENKKHKNKIKSMTNKELKEHILEKASFFQVLGGNYFYTEFFFLDRIEKIIHEKNKECVGIAKNLEEMGKIKLEARKVLNNFYNYRIIFKPYISEAEKRLKKNDLEWLSFEEIARLLDGKKVAISNRGKTNWILSKKNNWRLIEGKSAEKIIKKFNDYFFKNKVDNIKGTTANRGVYRGKVKIIRTIFSDNINEEIKKVEKGDVLVANTTGPEIMAACEKAGAIVTDEGGITSHAAIISRELKIPCVVGTRIATQVLKDGDLVEVDAKRGLVRKIK